MSLIFFLDLSALSKSTQASLSHCHTKSNRLSLKYTLHSIKVQVFWKDHKNLKKISHLFWQNSRVYSVASKQVGDFFKFLWSFQKSWTLMKIFQIIGKWKTGSGMKMVMKTKQKLRYAPNSPVPPANL